MRRILLGAVVIGAFLSLVAAGCDLSQNTTNSANTAIPTNTAVNQTGTITNTATATDPAPAGDVYTSTQYGFSVKVPTGYTVQADGAEFFFEGQDKQSSMPLPSITVISNATVDAAIAQLSAEDPSVQIKSTQATSVDGRSATAITYETAVGLTYKAIYVAKDQRVYRMREAGGVANSILANLQDTLHLL